MNSDVRKLTDGAMMIAIIGAVLLINRQTAGLLESMVLFLFPLPMVFYSAKYGLKDSWIVLFSIVILALILGTIQSVILVVSESVIGMIYGAGIYNHTSTRRIVIRTLILGGLVELLTMFVFASFFGYDIAGELSSYKEIIESVFSQTGTTLNMDIDSYLLTIIVFSTILTGVLEGFITHVIARMMLKRLRFHIEPSTPILEYYPPKWSGYLAIAGIIFNFVITSQFSSNDKLVNLALAYEMAGLMYLAFFGLITFIAYGKIKFPNSKFGPVLFAFLLFMFGTIILAMFGFIYITTDLHKNLLAELKGESNAEKN